ncbi:hypothetical protein BGX31_009504 [Mortierella sp. GBA43]|nr:hypothetical protein BGX31_009504 [Mortierella sp. GBA43]
MLETKPRPCVELRPSTISGAQAQLRATGGISMWPTRTGRLQVYREVDSQQPPHPPARPVLREQGSTVSAQTSKTHLGHTSTITQGTGITAKAPTRSVGLPASLQKLITRTIVISKNQTRPPPPIQATSYGTEGEGHLSRPARLGAGLPNTSTSQTSRRDPPRAPTPVPVRAPAVQPDGTGCLHADQRQALVAKQPLKHPNQRTVSGHIPSVQSGVGRGRNASQPIAGQQPSHESQIENLRPLVPVEESKQIAGHDEGLLVIKLEHASEKLNYPHEHKEVSEEPKEVGNSGVDWTPYGDTMYVDGIPPLQPEDAQTTNDNQKAITPEDPAKTTNSGSKHETRWDGITPDVDEYSEEIFEYMRKREIELTPAMEYLETIPQATWVWRTGVINTMSGICYYLKALPEVFHLAVHLLDRAVTQIIDLDVEKTGLVCILLSFKFEDRQMGMTTRFFVDYLTRKWNYVVDHQDFQDAERQVLRVLNYDLGWPGQLPFLRRYARALRDNGFASTVASYVLEVIVHTERHLHYYPSMQAAAAFYVGLNVQCGGDDWHERYKDKSEQLECESGYPLQDIQDAANEMVQFIGNHNIDGSSVFLKYGTSNYRAVSWRTKRWIEGLWGSAV